MKFFFKLLSIKIRGENDNNLVIFQLWSVNHPFLKSDLDFHHVILRHRTIGGHGLVLQDTNTYTLRFEKKKFLQIFTTNNIKYIFPEFEKMKIEYWRELWGCVIIFNMQGKFLGAICIQDIRLVMSLMTNKSTSDFGFGCQLYFSLCVIKKE